jgi:hypothetical protein
MKKQLAMIVLAALGASVQAQDSYVGVGLPGLFTLGYAHPMGSGWGLRADYAGGLNISKDGNQDGVNAVGSFKANRLGAYADWFPFSGGFRLVGGVTFNDIKADLNAVGGGTTTINNIPVDMTGQSFNVAIKFPSTTPYLGIGYGHHKSDNKGIGFFADVGFMLGSFTATTTTSLVGQTFSGQTIQQSDVDAQTQKMRDSLGSLNVLPSASIGLLYRY